MPERPITIRVGSGSVWLKLAKTVSNVGITNRRRIEIAITATASTTAG